MLCQATLRAHWFNGTDLGSQKAIAKSLIKLNLNASNAAALAKKTNANSATLTEIATSLANGTALTVPQNDLYGRFDLILTALLDETYQRFANLYTNWTRAIAAVVAGRNKPADDSISRRAARSGRG